MLDYFFAHPWLLAVLWGCMYVFDYLSTLWLARAYETTLAPYLLYEHGVELNPHMEKAIARRRGPGLLAFIALIFVFLIVFLSPLLGYFPAEFIAGALLLTWCFVDSRHLRNYAYVWSLRLRPDALKGRQEHSYWFMQRTLSADALAFSLLYLFLALLTFRIFFLGGVVTCLALAIRAYWLANRKFSKPAADESVLPPHSSTTP